MAAMSAPRASTAGAAGFAGCGGGVGGGSSGPGGSVPGARGMTAGDWTALRLRRARHAGLRSRGGGSWSFWWHAPGRRCLDRAVIQGGGHPERADRRSPVARSFEGVGFALAPARVPEISRRRLGHTDLRGRRTGCVHGLPRRSGEIVNQRSQLRVGRIEHEPRADGVECLLWSSGRQLTTRGGAKGHELLLVCARPLGGADRLAGSVVEAQAASLRPPAAAVRSRPLIASTASRGWRSPSAARRLPPLTRPQRADVGPGRPYQAWTRGCRYPRPAAVPCRYRGGYVPARGSAPPARRPFRRWRRRPATPSGLDDADAGVEQPCPHGFELLPQLFHVRVPIRRLLGHRPCDNVRQLADRCPARRIRWLAAPRGAA